MQTSETQFFMKFNPDSLDYEVIILFLFVLQVITYHFNLSY